MYSRGNESSWYDVGQICENGHLINSATKDSPDNNKNFCDKCGAKTITTCEKCNAEIQGYHHYPNVFGSTKIPVPSFCIECGEPYPWTKTRIEAAKELSKELGLSQEDVKTLDSSIEAIVKDTPAGTLSATKFKSIINKVKGPIVDALRDILVDIISETAKKIIWPELK